MITVRGPGRCAGCSFHVATQGHRDGCSGTAAIAPDPDPEWEKLGFVERLAHLAADDPAVYALGGASIKREADRIRAQRDGTLPPRSTATSIAQPGCSPVYVAAAIRRELNKLAAARQGCRNDTLAPVACAVFEFVKAGHANKRAAWDEMERIALAIGLEPSEITNTLKHQWKKVSPRAVPAPGIPVRVTEVTADQLRGDGV